MGKRRTCAWRLVREQKMTALDQQQWPHFEVVHSVEVTHVAWDDMPVPEPTHHIVYLCYTAKEPYTCFLIFDESPSYTWQFGRELLDRGRKGPEGIGPVSIKPIGRGLISVRLVGLNVESYQLAATTFTMRMAEVTKYLVKSYRVVAAEDESRFLDIDSLVDQLLKRPNTEGHSAT